MNDEIDRNQAGLMIGARRHGEPWPAGFEQLRNMGVVHAMLDRIEALEAELAVCREAIEVCLDVAERLPADDDGAAAVRRCTLRRLNEAIGKATPRLMMERPEGQKMYGLNYREMRQRIEADCTAMQQALDALELCRLNGSQYLYGNERDIVFSAIKTLRKRLK